jgi:hypothetical protein
MLCWVHRRFRFRSKQFFQINWFFVNQNTKGLGQKFEHVEKLRASLQEHFENF